jgi:hypothetical protein
MTSRCEKLFLAVHRSTERKPVGGYVEMCSRRVESPAQLARRGGPTPFGVSSRSVEAEPLIPPDGGV